MSLLHCLDVPIMIKSVLLAWSLSLLFVTQPEISLRQSPSCLRDRLGSAADKEDISKTFPDLIKFKDISRTWKMNLLFSRFSRMHGNPVKCFMMLN